MEKVSKVIPGKGDKGTPNNNNDESALVGDTDHEPKRINVELIPTFVEKLKKLKEIDELAVSLLEKAKDGDTDQESLKKLFILYPADQKTHEGYAFSIKQIKAHFDTSEVKEKYETFIKDCEKQLCRINVNISYLRMRDLLSQIIKKQVDLNVLENIIWISIIDPKVGQLGNCMDATMRFICELVEKRGDDESLMKSCFDVLKLCADDLFPKLNPIIIKDFSRIMSFSDMQTQILEYFLSSVWRAKMAVIEIEPHLLSSETNKDFKKDFWRIEAYYSRLYVFYSAMKLPSKMIGQHKLLVPKDGVVSLDSKVFQSFCEGAEDLDPLIQKVKNGACLIEDNDEYETFVSEYKNALALSKTAASKVSEAFKNIDVIPKGEARDWLSNFMRTLEKIPLIFLFHNMRNLSYQLHIPEKQEKIAGFLSRSLVLIEDFLAILPKFLTKVDYTPRSAMPTYVEASEIIVWAMHFLAKQGLAGCEQAHRLMHLFFSGEHLKEHYKHFSYEATVLLSEAMINMANEFDLAASGGKNQNSTLSKEECEQTKNDLISKLAANFADLEDVQVLLNEMNTPITQYEEEKLTFEQHEKAIDSLLAELANDKYKLTHIDLPNKPFFSFLFPEITPETLFDKNELVDMVRAARLKYNYCTFRNDAYALSLKIYILYLYHCLERILKDPLKGSQPDKLQKVLSNLSQLASYVSVRDNMDPKSGFLLQLRLGLNILTQVFYPAMCEKVFVIYDAATLDDEAKQRDLPNLHNNLFGSLKLFKETMTNAIKRLDSTPEANTFKINLAELHRWFSRAQIMTPYRKIKKDLFKPLVSNMLNLDIQRSNKKRLREVARKTLALDTLCDEFNKKPTIDFYFREMKIVFELRSEFISGITAVTKFKNAVTPQLEKEIIEFLDAFIALQSIIIYRALKNIILSLFNVSAVKSLMPKLLDYFKAVEQFIQTSKIYPENIQGKQLDYAELHIKILRAKIWCLELLAKKPMPDALFARDILSFLFDKQGALKNEFETCLSTTMKTHLCDMLVSLVNQYVSYSKLPIPEDANTKTQQNLNTRAINAAKQILKILNKTFSGEDAAKTCLEEHKDIVPQPKKKKPRKNRTRKNKKKSKAITHGKNRSLVWNSTAKGDNASSNKNSKAEDKKDKDNSNNNTTPTGALTPGNSSEVNE